MEKSRFLSFILGNEEFAIPLLTIKEVIAFNQKITKIPDVPDYYLGIINLRETIIPILDLRKKLKYPSNVSEQTSIIIVDFDNYEAGIVVDQVNSVLSISSEEIAPAPEIKKTGFVSGVFKKENLILLIDLKEAIGQNVVKDNYRKSS